MTKSSTPKPTGYKTITAQVRTVTGTQLQEHASTGGSLNGTLVNTLTDALSPSLVQQEFGKDLATGNELKDSEQNESPEIERSDRLEEAGTILQDVDETITAADKSPRVQEELLRIEVAAHQQTRGDFARLEDWCKRLEDENTRLQTDVDDAGRENANIRRQLHNAEDKLTRFGTHADGRIHGLMNSIKGYRSMIEQLQKQVVDLNASISWYSQLGINFHVRLQKAETMLKPNNRVFAEYKRLMNDAAEYFPVPVDLGNKNGAVQGDFVRVEELDDYDHNEKKDSDWKNDGVPILDAHKVTCEQMSANEAGATQPGDGVPALDDNDDDDDVPSLGRRMRPGTANRVPISVFAARSGNTAKEPSPSLFGNLAQQAQRPPSPATSAFPISFGFSESSAKPEEKCETPAVQGPAHEVNASNTSVRNRNGRGGIERGRGRRGRATDRRKAPLRNDRDLPSGDGKASTNAGVHSTPPLTAFPVHYGFSEC